jgi:hypothetical protein
LPWPHGAWKGSCLSPRPSIRWTVVEQRSCTVLVEIGGFLVFVELDFAVRSRSACDVLRLCAYTRWIHGCHSDPRAMYGYSSIVSSRVPCAVYFSCVRLGNPLSTCVVVRWLPKEHSAEFVASMNVLRDLMTSARASESTFALVSKGTNCALRIRGQCHGCL